MHLLTIWECLSQGMQIGDVLHPEPTLSILSVTQSVTPIPTQLAHFIELDYPSWSTLLIDLIGVPATRPGHDLDSQPIVPFATTSARQGVTTWD